MWRGFMLMPWVFLVMINMMLTCIFMFLLLDFGKTQNHILNSRYEIVVPPKLCTLVNTRTLGTCLFCILEGEVLRYWVRSFAFFPFEHFFITKSWFYNDQFWDLNDFEHFLFFYFSVTFIKIFRNIFKPIFFFALFPLK